MKRINHWMPLLMITVLTAATDVIGQPPPIELPQMTITAGHMEIVSVPGASASTQITGIRSQNTSIARATPYRANQVQIVAVAQGRTIVEFTVIGSAQHYTQPVWVEAPNATGGGGSGYDPTKTQLDQIVMAIRRTRNLAPPGAPGARISGVKSSNTGVATARTNPPNGIQIRAVGLGDTFIEFVGNGTTYQVHVWVTQTGAAPDGSGVDSGGSSSGGGGGGGGGPSPFGPCLTGTWISDSIILSGDQRGGSGIRLTFDRAGKITIDYSEMEQLVTYSGTEISGRSLWRGKAAFQVRFERDGSWSLRLINSDVIFRHEDSEGVGMEGKEDNNGGPGALIVSRFDCAGNTLKFRKVVYHRAP